MSSKAQTREKEMCIRDKYTCSLCGHSYTKPIAKLKDDNRPGAVSYTHLFELGCSRTGDGTISYKVSDEKVIKVSDTGEVTLSLIHIFSLTQLTK